MSSNQDSWEKLLPFLLGPYLEFLKNTTGNSDTKPFLGGTAKYNCQKASCRATRVDTLCFTVDGIQNYTITSCSCQKHEQAMVGHGLFPTSPALSWVTFPISLLDFFQTLLYEMSTPIPLAVILEKFYTSKGFAVSDHNGMGIFNKIEVALQQYRSLRLLLDLEVDRTLTMCEGLASLHREMTRPASSSAPRVKPGNASKNSDALNLEERRLGRGIQQIDGKLCDCFGSEMLAAELALRLPEFHYLTIPLTQWRDKLLSHGKRVIEEPAYSQHLHLSGELATRISKGKQPLTLTWKTRITVPPAADDVRGDNSSDSDVEVVDDKKANHPLDFRPHHPIQWSTMDYSESMQRDDRLLCDLSLVMNTFRTTPTAPTASRKSGLLTLGFVLTDARRLLVPDQILNDTCVNQCSSIIQSLFAASYTTASQCALLTSADLPRIMRKADAAEIWRFIQPTKYWKKTKWILPIHRPSELHWVLAVIAVPERKILVFDSLGSSYKNWSSDLSDIMELIQQFNQIAKDMGQQSIAEQEGQWTAQPIVSAKLQHNGFDCGVWVLAVIGAVLRGYWMTSMSENEIAQFRILLHDLIKILSR